MSFIPMGSNPVREAPESPIDILLVDDREDGLMALEAVLASKEYNLIRASSGMEAIARLYERDFALVLLDVQMPDMNGFDTAKIIRSHESSKNVPIIFITAINKDTPHIYEGYQSGAVDYIFKPFDPYVLKAKVRIFAELYRKNQKIREQARQLIQAERKRTADLSVLNRQLEAEMAERMKIQKDILDISEREQKRIGQDLHDGLAQQLTAMSFMCQLLWKKLESKMKEEAQIALQILDLNKKAITETKSMARLFYPIELEKLGFFAALQDLAGTTQKLFGIDCRCQLDATVQISDEETATHLYRIVQEAVHNSVRHGKAKDITIGVERQDGDIVVSVADNGRGFGAKPPLHGMGLRIMNYRSKMVGGDFTIEECGSGARVSCRVSGERADSKQPVLPQQGRRLFADDGAR